VKSGLGAPLAARSASTQQNVWRCAAAVCLGLETVWWRKRADPGQHRTCASERGRRPQERRRADSAAVA
jgi:hypothetical protein